MALCSQCYIYFPKLLNNYITINPSVNKFSPVNGGSNAAILYNRHPNDHISTFSLYFFYLTSSGLIYIGVPAAPVKASAPFIVLQNPRSAN